MVFGLNFYDSMILALSEKRSTTYFTCLDKVHLPLLLPQLSPLQISLVLGKRVGLRGEGWLDSAAAFTQAG